MRLRRGKPLPARELVPVKANDVREAMKMLVGGEVTLPKHICLSATNGILAEDDLLWVTPETAELTAKVLDRKSGTEE